jgi:hypothetical protein
MHYAANRNVAGSIPIEVIDYFSVCLILDRLCGLVVRVPGYRSGFDSRRCQLFREIMGLERGPLRLVNTTEELLGRKSSGSGLESREYCRKDP